MQRIRTAEQNGAAALNGKAAVVRPIHDRRLLRRAVRNDIDVRICKRDLNIAVVKDDRRKIRLAAEAVGCGQRRILDRNDRPAGAEGRMLPVKPQGAVTRKLTTANGERYGIERHERMP